MPMPPQLAPYAFKPGNPGKPMGAINRQDRMAREMLEACFTDVGGYEALVEWAKVNRTAFYTKLWSKFVITAAGSLPDEDKLDLVKSMLFVQRVQTQVFKGETVVDVEIEQESQVATSPPSPETLPVAPQSTISPPDVSKVQPTENNAPDVKSDLTDPKA